ncbi:MAG: helix-turn-helix domain-containing protein [Methanobacteriota archaeon]
MRVPGVRVLTPDEDDARAVARAMASSTAGGIIRSFQGQELTASDIANLLNLPISTIMYHLETLVEVGFIEVSRIRYSVKGREVKVYRQSDQVLIVAPRQDDIRAALLKYASLFGITICGAAVAALLSQMKYSEILEAGRTLGEMKEKAVMAAVANSPAEVVSDTASGGSSLISIAPSPTINPELWGISDLVVGILIGGCLVIGLLVCFDLVSRKRNR